MALVLDTDLADIQTYVQGTPNHLFAQLRRECPVYWNERVDGGTGMWCITKYADIAAIGRDPKRFTSTRGVNITRIPEEMAEVYAQSLLIFMDAPRHTRLRGLVNSTFTPKRALAMQPVIRNYASRAIDAVIGAGECDLFHVAASPPIATICALLGVPDEDHGRVLDWTNRTFGQEDPEYAAGPDDTAAAFSEVFGYALQLAADRRQDPRDDLMSELAHAEIDGEPITDMELSYLFFLFLTAGNDTTRTLILNAVNILLATGVWDELGADVSLIPNAVEEVLRLEPSVRGMGRTAIEDVTVRDVAIKAGDHLYMWYCSGNRDEDVFADPDRLDPRRPNASKHQSFGGGGPHFCSGAALARTQATIVIEELLSRMSDLELAGDPVRARATQFASFKHMPVRFSPGPKIVGQT